MLTIKQYFPYNLTNEKMNFYTVAASIYMHERVGIQ